MACPRCTRFSSGGSSPKLQKEVGGTWGRQQGAQGRWALLPRRGWETHCSRRRSLRTPGPSRAGSSEMRMASSMAASSPEPPSPRRAGPKHSGLRMSSRTTTFAFSSTLSPGGSGGSRGLMSHCPRDPAPAAQDPAAQGLTPGPHWPLDPAPAHLEESLPRLGLWLRMPTHPAEGWVRDPPPTPDSPLTKTAKRKKSR